MGLHLCFSACYAESAMDTSDRSQRSRLCRSPKLTPARLAARRSNARKHGRYARRLTSTLERRRRAGPTASHWWIVERISMHFRVDWQREQQKTGRPAWQV
ncbi:MAG: hypothetical protein ACRD1O_13615 [Terriglobia bacterium]